MRIAYVLLFCIVFSFMDIVLFLIALVQAVSSVVSGEPSQTLRNYGNRLASYLKQIANYVSFASDDKPFPFADFPKDTLVEDEQDPNKS